MLKMMKCFYSAVFHILYCEIPREGPADSGTTIYPNVRALSTSRDPTCFERKDRSLSQCLVYFHVEI